MALGLGLPLGSRLPLRLRLPLGRGLALRFGSLLLLPAFCLQSRLGLGLSLLVSLRAAPGFGFTSLLCPQARIGFTLALFGRCLCRSAPLAFGFGLTLAS